MARILEIVDTVADDVACSQCPHCAFPALYQFCEYHVALTELWDRLETWVYNDIESRIYPERAEGYPTSEQHERAVSGLIGRVLIAHRRNR